MPLWIVLGRSPRSKNACRATERASVVSDEFEEVLEEEEEEEDGEEVEKTALQLERMETSIAHV
jgi:hypothetical protein